MKPYREKFPVGTSVRVADLNALQRFRDRWLLHHRLAVEQLQFAGRIARVARVMFYHGGDVLYTLDEIPGIWHEVCVHPIDDSTRTT